MAFESDPSYDITAEIERAKAYPGFDTFMAWHNKKFEIDYEYDWGAPDGDPLEDFKPFAEWLVLTGQGRWGRSDENPVGQNGSIVDDNQSSEKAAVVEVMESPHEEMPDNQLGDPTLCPEEDESEVYVGSVKYSKNWQEELKSLMDVWEWWKCYVRAGGFLLDFTSSSELNHTPARNQFPLDIYYLLQASGGSEDYWVEEGWGPHDSAAAGDYSTSDDTIADYPTGGEWGDDCSGGPWQGDDWGDDWGDDCGDDWGDDWGDAHDHDDPNPGGDDLELMKELEDAIDKKVFQEKHTSRLNAIIKLFWCWTLYHMVDAIYIYTLILYSDTFIFYIYICIFIYIYMIDV